jgi:hypothetical protein
MKGHFTPEKHIGFEAAAWYWHFVDVVWLFLFAARSTSGAVTRPGGLPPGHKKGAGRNGPAPFRLKGI